MVGSLALAVASGFLGGITLLAAALGLLRARQRRALRMIGVVTLVVLLALALISGVAFLWLVALTASPMVSAFTLGAGLGAAVGVAVALVVGLSLVALLLIGSPARSATSGGAAYGYGPVGRRMTQMTHW